MTDDTILPFSFPAVHAKKVTAAFDGGRLTSNGGVMLLAMAERRLGLADNLARVFPDRRDPTRVVHSLVDMFRAAPYAVHAHVSEPDLAPVGSTEVDHHSVSEALRKSGYAGSLSIEMKQTSDWASALRRAVSFTREIYSR